MGFLRSRLLALLGTECRRVLRLVLPILGGRDAWSISRYTRQFSFRGEVEAMMFFHRNTPIPIPTVYDA